MQLSWSSLIIFIFCFQFYGFGQKSREIPNTEVPESSNIQGFGVTSIKENQVEDLILTKLFGGSCLEIRNLTFQSGINPVNQELYQIGSFQKEKFLDIGFDEGIILSTGKIDLALGPNTANTSFENNVGGVPEIPNSNDAAIIEFEFLPSGDEISFNYVFASEEYRDYVCEDFNDTFSFFIKEAGTNDAFENIALIPNSNLPVTIDNVNDKFGILDCVPFDYSFYYNDNPYNSPIHNYNGYTEIFTARATNLNVCSWYKLKIVVTDVGDSGIDSAVFLEANSFNDNNNVNIDAIGSIPQTNLIEETCKNGYFEFIRDEESDITQPFVVEFQISGTAVEGVDYEQLPRSISIPPNENSYQLPIHTYFDNDNEGNETIVLETTNIFCGCSSQLLTAILQIVDYSQIPEEIDVTVCENVPYELPDGSFTVDAGSFESLIPRESDPSCDSLIVTNISRYPTPDVSNLVIDKINCDPNAEIRVNLVDYEPDFIFESRTSVSVQYFSSLEDFELNRNEITDPENYRITGPVVFVKVGFLNDDQCFSKAELVFDLLLSPDIVNTELVTCAETYNQTTATFDLSSLIPTIQAGNGQILVSFHETLADADASVSGGLNPISESNYDSGTTTIYSRSQTPDDNGNFCYVTAPVELKLIDKPTSFDNTLTFCAAGNAAQITELDFDINLQDDEDFLLYRTLENAEQDVDPVIFPIALPTGTYYLKIWNTSYGCFTINEVDIQVYPYPIIDFGHIWACQQRGNYGFELGKLRDDIQTSYPYLDIFFFEDSDRTRPASDYYITDKDSLLVVYDIPNSTCQTERMIQLLRRPTDSVEFRAVFCKNSTFTLPNGDVVSEPGNYKGTYFNGISECDYHYSLDLYEAEILFPNAFTPGSNNINDTFRPVLKEGCELDLSNYLLIVYDRWGQEIFRTTDFKTGWDGIAHGGEQENIFLWHATYTYLDEDFAKSGVVYVIH